MLATRRAFVRTFSLGTVALLAAACGAPQASAPPTAAPPAAKPTTAPAPVGQPTTASAPAAQPTAAQAAPAAGLSKPQPKVQRVVLGAARPTYEGNNPYFDNGPFDNFPLKPMYESLIGMDATTGKRIPELAESWSIEDGGRTIRFKLRKGVQFHGGFGEFTARDVKHSFETLMAQPPDTRAIVSQTELKAGIEGVEIVNDYEVLFRAKISDITLLYQWTVNNTGSEITSKADFDSRGGKMPNGPSEKPLAGTGPYQYSERSQGQFIRFERVPYQHWRETPDFPELEIRFNSENAARQAALLAGEIHGTGLPRDLVEGALARGLKRLESSEALVSAISPLYGSYLKDPLNSDELLHPDSPINNRLVRQAINKAIDRDALNKAFYEGKAEPMYLHLFKPGLPGWDPQFQTRFQEMYGYDQDAARKLLAEAGYGPGGKEIRVEVLAQPNAANPEASEVMEAISGMLRRVGIDAPIEGIDPVALATRNRVNVLGSKSHAGFIAPPVADQLYISRIYFTPVSGGRSLSVDRRQAIREFSAVVAETDDDKREPLWRDFGLKAYEYFPNIPLFWLRSNVIVDPKVIGSYTFPGNQIGAYTHLWTLKSA
jgi:peptide/nickel transport system substrate-binding protein